MRIAKYRAYIKKLGWMVPVYRLNLDCQTVEVDFTDGNGDTAEYGFDEIELMEFTGLYDSTKWDDLPEFKKQDFWHENCSEDGIKIRYQHVEDVKHLWKGRKIYEGDILMQNSNPNNLSRVCFGEFGVRDIETEGVVDKCVGWYIKVLKTDAMSELEPFCYDMQLNDYWIKETEVVVISNIYERPELEDAMNEDSLS